MTNKPTGGVDSTPEPTDPREGFVKDTGPQVPSPHERPADIDRKIKGAVDDMLEDLRNPYEAVVVAALEARRLNELRLKERSILNQAVEAVEELVPDVPFVPRPIEDEVPEVKATNEALERVALGLVDYHIDGAKKTTANYYRGEFDFSLYPDEDTESGASTP